jgi:hypothetical protein
MAGMSVESSDSDFRSRVRDLQIMEKLGMQSDEPSGCLALLPGPPAESIRIAIERLADPEQRILEELFWFWPTQAGTAKQDTALLALQQNTDDGTAIWKQHSDDGLVRQVRCGDHPAVTIWRHHCDDSKDEVAVHNLAVYYHTRALDSELTASSDGSGTSPNLEEDWNQAWKYWCLLIEHRPFWDRLTKRIESLDDPRLNTALSASIQAGLLGWIANINSQLAFQACLQSESLSARRHLQILAASDVDESDRVRLLERAVQPVRTSLKTLCTHVEAAVSANKAQSDHAITEFINEARPLLRTLSELLPSGNSIRDGEHDQVASLARGLLVDFANESHNWRVCRRILIECSDLATSASVCSQVSRDLKYVDDELELASCWFCKQNDPVKGSSPAVEMYGNVSKSGTQVQWKTHKVEVPRCLRCQRTHIARRLFFAATVGIVAALALWSEEPGLTAVVSTILMLIGWEVAAFLRVPPLDALFGSDKKSILPEWTKRKFPVVAHLQSEGWFFGSRPDNVNLGAFHKSNGSGWIKVLASIALFSALYVFITNVKPDSLQAIKQSSSSSPRPVDHTKPPEGFTEPVAVPGNQTTPSSGVASVSDIQETTPRSNRNHSDVNALEGEIESSKSRIQELKTSVEDCRATVDGYDGQISEDKQTLERMVSDDRAGISVDHNEYESVRNRHNRNVRLHNDKLSECRSLANQHDELVDQTNAKVREYNRLQGAQ